MSNDSFSQFPVESPRPAGIAISKRLAFALSNRTWADLCLLQKPGLDELRQWLADRELQLTDCAVQSQSPSRTDARRNERTLFP
jgi:hypothetical protein